MEQNYIGENIRIYRERANLTQQQLADKVGITWEMISRYERNESLPFRKLDGISRALDVPKSQLVERHTPQRYSVMDFKVPLFTTFPKSNRFYPSHTNYYYVCPEWILKRDRECIAIDSSLINSDGKEFNRDGVVYISKNIKPITNDYVLIRDSNGLITERYTNTNCNVLGKVLAQEIRY